MRFGFPVIDNDHEQVLHLAADVQSAINQLAPVAVIGQKFQQLVQFSLAHFRREEDLMEQWHYPAFAAHRQEHEELAEWMRHIEAAFRADGELAQAAAPQDILDLFQAWIYKHLIHLDKPMTRFLIARTAEGESRPAPTVGYSVEDEPMVDDAADPVLQRAGRG